MDNFIITLTALPGKGSAITDFYTSQQADLDAAKGFNGRTIYCSRPGTMADHLRKVMTPEQMAGHPDPGQDGSVHFVIIEKWDSIADRMAFSATQDKSRNAALIPNLKPQHTHEYYDDVS
jgi:hypothetical protein